ncbi:hypothetical protein BC826DRAFT_282806 [Russula brevipes]|nr:hypothetical protein BC826DRAFT_282806 [Russula brevipes]
MHAWQPVVGASTSRSEAYSHGNVYVRHMFPIGYAPADHSPLSQICSEQTRPLRSDNSASESAVQQSDTCVVTTQLQCACFRLTVLSFTHVIRVASLPRSQISVLWKFRSRSEHTGLCHSGDRKRGFIHPEERALCRFDSRRKAYSTALLAFLWVINSPVEASYLMNI